jgi:hypothetical protein
VTSIRSVLHIADAQDVDEHRLSRLVPVTKDHAGGVFVRLPDFASDDDWSRLKDLLKQHLPGRPSDHGVIGIGTNAKRDAPHAITMVVERHLEDGFDIWVNARSRRLKRSERVTSHGRTVFLDDHESDRFFRDPDGSGPPLELIVRVASECGPLVIDLCQRPRTILRRRRSRESIERIQQIDTTCMRWLACRPGRTIAEKAGPSQKVLGVVREQSLDTLENRVLRDFLRRCLVGSNVYLSNHSKSVRSGEIERKHDYVKEVEQFSRICRSLTNNTEIGRLSPASGPVTPNYALQFGERYRSLWYWYEQLVRREDQIGSAIPWCSRMFSERMGIEIARRLRTELKSTLVNRIVMGEEHVFGTMTREPWGMTFGPFMDGNGESLVLDMIPESGLDAWHSDRVASSYPNIDLLFHLHEPFDSKKGRLLALQLGVGQSTDSSEAQTSSVGAVIQTRLMTGRLEDGEVRFEAPNIKERDLISQLPAAEVAQEVMTWLEIHS